MDKRGKAVLIIGVVTGIILVCGVAVVSLLHVRNNDSVLESTMESTISVIETVTEETEKFSNNLSDYVGSVVVSTYIEDKYVGDCLSEISKVMKSNLAIYLYGITFDRDSEDVELSYSWYDSSTGEFGNDDLVLSFDGSEYDLNVVREAYEGQVTVYK